MKLETVISILIIACILGAFFYAIECEASPWDKGFQGPVAEPTCKDKRVRCA